MHDPLDPIILSCRFERRPRKCRWLREFAPDAAPRVGLLRVAAYHDDWLRSDPSLTVFADKPPRMRPHFSVVVECLPDQEKSPSAVKTPTNPG